MSESARAGTRIGLRYFEDVLAVEFARIAHRRARRPEGLRRTPVSLSQPRESAPVREKSAAPAAEAADGPNRRRAPDHKQLLARAKVFAVAISAGAKPALGPHADAGAPDEDKQRPLPVPCDATGLSLSGGGIRSSAVGLGVLQALYARGRLGSVDYISTVSGGGYIGASLTGGLREIRPAGGGESPFGDEVADSPAVAHLRDYSNYLFPRERSALRNWTDVVAILLRGLVANAVPVSATLLLLAIVTAFAFPSFGDLLKGSYLPSLTDRLTSFVERWFSFHIISANAIVGHRQFAFTLVLLCLLALVLVAWALARSASVRSESWRDADSRALQTSGAMVGVVAVSAFLDLQPIAIHALASVLGFLGANPPPPQSILEAGAGLGVSGRSRWSKISAASLVRRNRRGAFGRGACIPNPSCRDPKRQDLDGRRREGSGPDRSCGRGGHGRAAGAVGGIPLSRRHDHRGVDLVSAPARRRAIRRLRRPDHWRFPSQRQRLLAAPKFCRDRLSRAFLFWFPTGGDHSIRYLDDQKLSELKEGAGPYPVINSALNVEGSKMANKRGRNADFFTFTPDFVGSDLTLFASTQDDGDGRPGMETIEPALNLATAMAISGAAVSANMGSSTSRALTPTLALLNVRLGYWVRNPRDLAKSPLGAGLLKRARQFIASRLWLLVEAFGLLDENSPHVYLTDGGHIENLGILRTHQAWLQTDCRRRR